MTHFSAPLWLEPIFKAHTLSFLSHIAGQTEFSHLIEFADLIPPKFLANIRNAMNEEKKAGKRGPQTHSPTYTHEG